MDMKNWKTTIGGLVVALPNVLTAVGIVIPDPISKLIMALGAIWFAYFAKDKDVTGGTTIQSSGGIN